MVEALQEIFFFGIVSGAFQENVFDAFVRLANRAPGICLTGSFLKPNLVNALP